MATKRCDDCKVGCARFTCATCHKNLCDNCVHTEYRPYAARICYSCKTKKEKQAET